MIVRCMSKRKRFVVRAGLCIMYRALWLLCELRGGNCKQEVN